MFVILVKKRLRSTPEVFFHSALGHGKVVSVIQKEGVVARPSLEMTGKS